MIIQCIWDRQVDAIIDVKLGDADADTYKYEPITSLLTRWEISRKTSTVSTVTTNRKKNPVCSFSGMNAREGNPICGLSILSSHGREKGRTAFTSTGVGKRTHHNHFCEVLLTDDPRSLAP